VEVLQVYNYYSQYISNRIAADGAPVAKTVLIKSMRSVKKETLRLMQTFIKDCPDTQLAAVYERFIPALIDMVLDDYKVAVPDARDAEVMLLFTAVIDKLKGAAIELVGRVFAAVFGPTLDMIKTNFEDYPDHRVMFFKLIQSILTHAFPAVLQLSAQECRLVVDSIVWAFQHLERNVADTGLTCLATLVDKISRSSDANTFFQTFYLRLINELFGVLTDTFHKANFKLHAQIIARFFAIVSGGLITVPLWEGQVVQQQFTNNQDFVTMYVCNLLKSSFPHCDAKTIQAFVVGCFQTCGPSKLNQFKRHVRDFLVQLKEFSAEDNSDLYLEEQERQAKLQSEQKDQSRF
jgi:exportin-1